MQYQDLRGQSADDIFTSVADADGVPLDTLRKIWKKESGEGANLYNGNSGAMGHMQIMPRELGVMRERYGHDLDPNNLADSVFMAGKMLKENLDHFGNLRDAVAAYNGGWDKAKWNNPETRDYVHFVLGQKTEPTPDLNRTTPREYEATLSGDQAAAAEQAAYDKKANKMTPLEKVKWGAMMLQAHDSGMEDDDIVSQAAAVAANPEALGGVLHEDNGARPDTNYDNANKEINNQITDDVNANKASEHTVGETIQAALNTSNLTQQIYNSVAGATADNIDNRYRPDPAWVEEYQSKRDEMIKGLTPAAVSDMDNSLNREDALRIAKQDTDDQKNMKVLMDSEHPLLWGLAAGILDPAAIAVGFGIGKAYQVGRAARMAAVMEGMTAETRAAFAAAQGARSTLGRVVEGAAVNATANVAITGAMQALGQHMDSGDYFHAAAIGGIMGGAFGLLFKDHGAYAQHLASEQHDKGVADFYRRLKTVQEANPNASADQLRTMASKLGIDEINNTLDRMVAIGKGADNKLYRQYTIRDPIEPVNIPEARAAVAGEVVPDSIEVGGRIYMKPKFESFKSEEAINKYLMQRMAQVPKEVFPMFRAAAEERIAQLNKATADAANIPAAGTSALSPNRVKVGSDVARRQLAEHSRTGFKDLTDEELASLVQDARPARGSDTQAFKGYNKAVKELEKRGVDSDTLAYKTPPSASQEATAAQEAATPETGKTDTEIPEDQGYYMTQNEYDNIVEMFGLQGVNPQVLPSVVSMYRSAMDLQMKYRGLINSGRIAEEEKRAISDVMGWRSSGHQLITDKNLLARMAGVFLAEDAGGVSGIRTPTAALRSVYLRNRFLHNMERNHAQLFYNWTAERGLGRTRATLETFTTGKLLQQFNQEVAEEIRSRGSKNYRPNGSKAVVAAANDAENRFTEMGAAGREAEVLGHENIPESSRGYLPQQFNGKVYAELSAENKDIVREELIRQGVQKFGWDSDFSNYFVRKYLNRAEDEARGISSSGAQPSTSPYNMAQDALDMLAEATDLEPAVRAAMEKRVTAGAARFTRHRIEWDMTVPLQLDDGRVVPLSDLYSSDVPNLIRGYANRMSADIGIGYYGLKGERDLRLLKEGISRSTVGNPKETIPALTQLINEIYHRPTALDTVTKVGAASRFVRVFTGIRLLGGVAFPQMVELSNAIGHLGVVNTIHIAARVPGVWREIADLKAGRVPETSILSSLDIVAGSPLGSEQFQMVLPQIVDDNLSVIDSGNMGKLHNLMSGGQILHNKFSFIRSVTAVQQRAVGEEILRKAMRYINSNKEDVALADMGFNPELRAKLVEAMPRMAQFDERGYLKAFDARVLDPATADELAMVIRRGTGQIIQETFPGETGKWMRSEVTQLLMQFRRFPSVAVEKQMYRQFKNLGTARALGSSVGAMTLGTLLYMGRAQIAASMLPSDKREEYLSRRLAPSAIMNGAVMYVSNFGMTSDFMQLGTGVGTYFDKQFDLGLTNGQGVPTQGVGSLIPALSTVGDMYNFTQSPSVEKALKLAPFTNLPAVSPFYNYLRYADDE